MSVAAILANLGMLASVSALNPTPYALLVGLTYGSPAVAATIVAFLVLQLSLVAWFLSEHRRRQRAEVESRRHLATMAHMDRRITVGELATLVTHELYQPLGAMLRNAEAASMLLGSGRPDLDEIRAIVDDIRSDNRRASDLLRRMRLLLGNHEIEMTAVDLGAVALEAGRFVAPDAASKAVRVRFDTSPEPAIVMGDHIHLLQVVLNLIVNGVDAAHAGQRRREVVVTTSCRHDGVELSVTDSGPGFAPDALSRVFHPFYSTKKNGMGIGLTVTRSIVEAHAGRVRASNNPEGGATVRVTLPRGAVGTPQTA